MKDNIIQFPTKFRIQEVEEEREFLRQEYEDFTDECRDVSRIILLQIEELLLNESSYFDAMDFRDERLPEAKDMIVIVNMISSMLMRHGGVNHFLHDYFEVLHELIMDKKE